MDVINDLERAGLVNDRDGSLFGVDLRENKKRNCSSDTSFKEISFKWKQINEIVTQGGVAKWGAVKECR